MTKFFKDKGKKPGVHLLILFALGVLLLFSGSSLFKNKRADILPFAAINERTDEAAETTSAREEASYEAALERRLETAFGQVEGVGKIKVMITLAAGREIVVDKETVRDESATLETDEAGGSRSIQNTKSEDATVLLEKNGTAEPLVLKEYEPKIEGVIIVAEGGADIAIKDLLIRSCESLLGVATHKIQVLKMK